MTSEILTIRLTNSECSYLRKRNFFHDFKLQINSPSITNPAIQSPVHILIEASEADKLHGALTELLAQVGFDEEYELNQEGKLIDGLITKVFNEKIQHEP